MPTIARVRRHRDSRGFTLLEVLIALAVLALSAMAVLRQTGQSLPQQQQLADKTVALVLAKNRLAMYQAADTWPATGRDSQRIDYAGIRWQVDTDISATSEAWLRKIEVSVQRSQQGEDYPAVTLVAYRGRY